MTGQTLPPQALPVQVFAGQVDGGQIRVDQPHTVRSVQFSKAVAETRLRITYRDRAETAPSSGEFTAAVVVRVDGVPLPLLDTVFDAARASDLGAFESFRVASPFTTVGWVSGVAAGTHSLETGYVLTGDNRPVVGFISSSPYLVEIDEQP
jgi:hypothetical protein